jgi:hypothetical protein
MTHFVFNPADPFDAVDAEYVMIGHPDITIQVAPYIPSEKFTVNVWVEAEEAMYHFPFRTLAAAKGKALQIAQKGLPA